LALRRRQLSEYQQALRAAKAKKRARVAKALELNIARLRDRIRKLRRQQLLLAVKDRIAGRGKLPNVEGAVDAARRNYERLAETAEQTLALEPEDESAAAAYIRDRETPAFQAAFGGLEGWRNTILGGQETATLRLAGLQARIDKLMALRGKHPKAWKKHRFKIPLLRAAMNQVRGFFNPGPPESGTLEEALDDVQGDSRPRTKGPLPTEPVPGAWGGVVWDTQLQLRELGIRLTQALESGGDSESGSEREALLEQLAREAGQRAAASDALRKVLPGWDELRQGILANFAGGFYKGGTIPAGKWGIVGERGEEIVHGPAGITPMSPVGIEQMAAAGGARGSVNVVVNGTITQEPGDTRPAIEVRDAGGDVIEKVFASRGAGRRHPSAFNTRP
jgi:hypothetical protein